MLGRLRIPFFALALIVLLVVIGLETGSALFVKAGGIGADTAARISDAANQQDIERARAENGAPPGFSVASLALIDVILLFTVALMGVSMIVPQPIHARFQGCATCLFTCLSCMPAIGVALAALLAVMTMILLLIAFPFGTIIYAIVYGSFPRGDVLLVLSIIMGLKILFIVLLLLAHQRFLQNLGLMLLILLSLAGGVIVNFIISFPPGILVSIADGVAAIVVAILSIVCLIPLFVGALIGIVTALKPGSLPKLRIQE